MVDAKKLLEKFEADYKEAKNKECEDLHNAIADVLAQKKATVQNILFVIKLIEFELLRAKYEELLGNVVVLEGGGVKRDAKLG